MATVYHAKRRVRLGSQLGGYGRSRARSRQHKPVKSVLGPQTPVAGRLKMPSQTFGVLCKPAVSRRTLTAEQRSRIGCHSISAFHRSPFLRQISPTGVTLQKVWSLFLCPPHVGSENF